MSHDRYRSDDDPAPTVDPRDAELDAPLHAAKPPTGDDEPNVLLREGADAPDAADIADPDRQL